jgi:type IV secretory pathway VirJ component
LAPGPGGVPRWTALQGRIDQVCDPLEVNRFVGRIRSARCVLLPKVGHGFAVPRNWGSAYDAAVEGLLEPATAWETAPAPPSRSGANRAPEAISRRLESLGLPLEIGWPDAASDALIFISGDGGWVELDREVASRLVRSGIAVIGWNTLHYFWEPKAPERFRSDLSRVITALPREMKIFAGGYSFGAEVVPVALDPEAKPRLPGLDRIAGMVLLAPGSYATFEVSPLDWIFSNTLPTDYPVRRAIGSSLGLPVLCLEPISARNSGCPPNPRPGVTRLRLPGSHHFGGDYAGIARRITKFLRDGRD